MGLLKLLNEIDTAQLDKEVKDQFLSRKDALGKLSNFSKKLAVAALPLGAVSTLAGPARAQDSGQIISSLNFALTLEFLEYRYYEKGLASGVIDAEDQAIFAQIEKHEEAHTLVLQDTINSLGGTPVEEPAFDFTAGGTFDPLNSYAQFLALSQAFEDTGVRAYKGQAGNVAGSAAVLTAALQIHSVEARHASQVRRMRGSKGWITQDNGIEGVSQADAVYAGEDSTTQAEANVTAVTEIDANGITEAWDEPLTMDQVNSVASLFIEG
ncbi:ferritin-like domain-containing protein [Fodinibius sediminis]|uniref:Ferritin-like domain-containing protein n=1 Tax=Fodinibius sediminis TaxID=1214077 RepID=A0A521DWE2_9BACT|nr:ferritin-like domain-containing protein [Fodinibius sediminis]SMO76006.1 Ferritin-like domain-containing protein [Fodinibius sediminis]